MKSVLEVYADIAKANPTWTDEEEREFVKSCTTPSGGWKDKNRFVNEAMKHNLGMVFDLVTRKAFEKNEDIVQKCVVAMVEALKKYDPKQGKKISTWIYNPIVWAIHQSRHAYSRFGTMADELSALNHKYKTRYRVVSLDSKAGDDTDSETIGNLISSNDVDVNYIQLNDIKCEEDKARERDFHNGVAEMMDELPNILTEREIFVMKGLLEGRSMSDISIELKLSRMRVSQISAKAFEKIRRSRVGRKLKELV